MNSARYELRRANIQLACSYPVCHRLEEQGGSKVERRHVPSLLERAKTRDVTSLVTKHSRKGCVLETVSADQPSAQPSALRLRLARHTHR